MNRRTKIILGIKYLFIPELKYWKPTLYAFLIFIVVIVAIGFSVNLKNTNHLEKRIGIVDYMYNYAYRDKSNVWLNYNFKLEGDSQIYGQKLYFDNHPPFNLFLFNYLHFPAKEMLGIAKGDTLEFYTDIPQKSFPFLLVPVDEGKDYKKEKNTDETVITSYGLKANGKTLFSYTKRAFVVDYSRYIHAILVLFYIVLLAGFGYNLVQKIWSIDIYIKDLDLKEQFLSELPLTENIFRPIVFDENLTLIQQIVNLRKFAPTGSDRFYQIVEVANNYWYFLNEFDKAEILYRSLLEAYPNNFYVWDGYYRMLEKQKRKNDIYALEEKLYALDSSNAETFAGWYEAAAKRKRHKYWKNRITGDNIKNEDNVKDRTFANKMMWTILIHMIAIIIHLCICAIPQLYNSLQVTDPTPRTSSSYRGEGAGLMLIFFLPDIFIAFIWGKGIIGTLGNARKKIPFALWIIFNCILSVVYTVAIYINFQ